MSGENEQKAILQRDRRLAETGEMVIGGGERILCRNGAVASLDPDDLNPAAGDVCAG